MSKTQWAITVFFWVVMGLQVRHVHRPMRVNYTVYADHYQWANATVRKNNDETIAYIDREVPAHRMYPPADSLAHFVDSLTTIAYKKLDDYKRQIALAAGTNVAINGIPALKSKRIAYSIFAAKKGCDSINVCLQYVIDSMLTIINPADSARMNSSIRYILWPGVWKNGIDCTELFKEATLSSANTSLWMLQHSLLSTERMILQCIFEDYHSFGDHFDTIAGVAIVKQSWVAEHDIVQANVSLLVLSPHQTNHRAYANEGTIKMDRSIAQWSGIAGSPGMHTVRGTDTLRTEDDIRVSQWSFNYFVVQRGAATLQLDHMQRCYLNVPTTIKVQAPGYAADKVLLRVPGARVKKLSAGVFEVLVTDLAKGKLKAYTDAISEQGVTTTVLITDLTVKDLPTPLSSVEGATDGVIGLDALMAGKVVVSSPDEDVVVSYRVRRYAASVLKQDRSFVEPVVCTDAALGHVLSGIEVGDKVYISDVVAVGPGNREVEVMGCAVVVR